MRKTARGLAVSGQSLHRIPYGMNPHSDKGRVASLETLPLEHWRQWQRGSQIVLPGFDGGELRAEIGLVKQEGNWLRVGGVLKDQAGSFSLHTDFQRVSGLVLFPAQNVAWEISTERSGELAMVERRLEAVICLNFSRSSDVQGAMVSGECAGSGGSLTTETIFGGAPVPSINTRPGAKGIVYLDFDGETVSDPAWDDGNTIIAAPTDLTPDQIRQIMDRVVEDFAPFDLTFTTDRGLYDSAAVGRRMRLIITPTKQAAYRYGDVEGIAEIDSWSRAGVSLSSDIPAWVFDTSGCPKIVAEVISHELGHTLGLSHDGQLASAGRPLVPYYPGHPDDWGRPVSWAPIMGRSYPTREFPYSRPLTQWSKGDYEYANNTEDDLAILSKRANGFGYISPSLSENLPVSPDFSEGTFSFSGTLRADSKPHLLQFETSGGYYSVSANPASPGITNVDLRLELLNAEGEVEASSDLQDALGAALSGTLSAGTYQFRVSSAGASHVSSGNAAGGYPAYGSLGPFLLSGAIGGVSQKPFFLREPVRMLLGERFSGATPVSGATRIEVLPESLPEGIELDPATGQLSGIPGKPGSWSLPLVASNSLGATAGSVQILVEPHARPLDAVLGDVSRNVVTTPVFPWSTAYGTLSDGRPGWMATSGLLPNSASSGLRFLVVSSASVSEPFSLGFWCKTSSEFQKDFFECRVNGRLAPDLLTGQPVRISGETDWIPCRVLLPTRVSLIDLRYVKDASREKNEDRVRVHGLEVGRLPVVQGAPRSLRIAAGADIEMSAQVSGASSMRWIRDGLPLKDSSTDVRSVEGATSAMLSIRGATVLDAGLYRLEARNSFGRSVSPVIRVTVDGAPQIEEIPAIPTRLKTGDTLVIPARIGGSPPLRCVWTKDGVPVQVSSQPSFQRSRITTAASGKYMLTVSNRLGSTLSREVMVEVAPE